MEDANKRMLSKYLWIEKYKAIFFIMDAFWNETNASENGNVKELLTWLLIKKSLL